MTAPVAWKLGQSTLDRAGGVLRLHLLSKRLVGRTFTIEDAEENGWIGVRVRVKSAQRGHAKLASWDEWITYAGVARSAAVREDQRDMATGDALVLEDVIRAEVARLESDEGLSELELRYRYGDR
jgi:hypothetical protein